MKHRSAINIPTVRVVIPTYNRPESLLTSLQALAAQDFPSESTEVIAVDDGSDVSYSSVFRLEWPFRFRYQFQENAGEIEARNLGASQCKAEFLVFIDDDIVTSRTFLSSLIEEHSNWPNAVLVGRIVPLIRPSDSLFRQVIGANDETHHDCRDPVIESKSGALGVPTKVFKALGGMLPLGSGGRNAWGGLDFAHRADQAGYPVRCCHQAIGYHDDDAMESLSSYCRRVFSVSRLAILEFERMEGLQSRLPMFRDKTPINWHTDSGSLILRKLARSVASSDIILRPLEWTAEVLQTLDAPPEMLRPLIRWIIGSHIYQGLRAGYRESGLE